MIFLEGIKPFIFTNALAHEGAADTQTAIFAKPLDQLISHISLQTVYIAAIALGFLIFMAIIVRNPSELAKRILFWLITITVMVSTALLVGMTIYLNQVSATNGPVHWHADYQVWACNERQDLIEPVGISNKVGLPAVHEHNDGRIHIEGALVNLHDADLGAFFRAVGGELTNQSLTMPTNSGTKNFINGEDCNGQTASVQAFVIEADLANKTYSQEKIDDPANFLFKPESQVPPGDCIIIEFDQPKDRTNHLCESYQVAIERGDLLKEVPHNQMEQDDH